jgi:phage baseplate assembly protein W
LKDIYSDISFIIHPISKDLTTIKGAESIKNAIKNLVLTNFYERHFYEGKGSNLSALLFEPLDSVTCLSLKTAILDILQQYEPRAETIQVQVEPEFEQNSFRVNVIFAIKAIVEPITFSLFLKRLR